MFLAILLVCLAIMAFCAAYIGGKEIKESLFPTPKR
jgi:hypothetical protein